MEEVGDYPQDDGDVCDSPLLIVMSKHEVKPVRDRFYVVDGDGDICGLNEEQISGFPILSFAAVAAKDIERLHGVIVNVSIVEDEKDRLPANVKYQWQTVWRLGDRKPKRGCGKQPAPAGSTHSDFGTW